MRRFVFCRQCIAYISLGQPHVTTIRHLHILLLFTTLPHLQSAALSITIAGKRISASQSPSAPPDQPKNQAPITRSNPFPWREKPCNSRLTSFSLSHSSDSPHSLTPFRQPRLSTLSSTEPAPSPTWPPASSEEMDLEPAKTCARPARRAWPVVRTFTPSRSRVASVRGMRCSVRLVSGLPGSPLSCPLSPSFSEHGRWQL